ncbi:DUF559 domain-containing protein [Rhodococcus sp. Eu-32]|uniref:DUF559 domain-containing protein n=1 Tax=Rhodococcus sp. Eu-32 TaxID=1017319 RepID=UPI000DF25D9A|nr:DUF559 domain-containing protein [Rhodococcus sp. Eu-32]RRQ29182.1 DUF559 domain-containing protein [Rhodococcus sp. Eu-32]
MSSSSIARRYVRVLPEIYCSEEPSAMARCYAITLWQPTALLSHRTAAWLYGWIEEPAVFEICLGPGVKPRLPSWITMYRRTLPAGERVAHGGLPVPIKPRTLIDCVAVMTLQDAARLVDQRLTTDVDRDQVTSLIGRTPNLRGNKRASGLIATASIGFASEPERVLGRTLIVLGLRMRVNYRVGDYICDLVDEWAMVIVEVDGREFHSAPEVFRKDRRRQNHLVLEGWLVLRYSAFDVLSDPEKVAREIVEVVRRRRNSRKRRT